MTYPVHERFATFQGEGVHAGRAAYFIRLFGCPVQCPWCDSAGTWHPAYVPKDIKREEVLALADAAIQSGAELCVITGGEPAIHDLSELIEALHDDSFSVHLETSGAFKVRGEPDWITVSPKREKLPLPDTLNRASELKIIVDHLSAIDEWERTLALTRSFSQWRGNVWLHPEWSQRNDSTILRSISNAVKQHPNIYRAGWQMHKLYAVDSLDAGSRPLVPLGGNPSLGI